MSCSCCYDNTKGLDEYDLYELEAEVDRRYQLALEGRCAHCGRLGSSPYCGVRSLHSDARRQLNAIKEKTHD